MKNSKSTLRVRITHNGNELQDMIKELTDLENKINEFKLNVGMETLEEKQED